MIDYYELLGIKKDANEQEIKSAYRQMAKKYHPDVNKSEDANKIIISLNEAKETLLDKEKRMKYDNLLEEIKHAKQVSKNKDETYSTKKEEYKETYSETYITKWQFLMNYLQNGLDKTWIKIIKSLLVTINFFIFAFIKLFMIILVYLLCILEPLIDYLSGIIMFLAILALFIVSKEQAPMYIAFIPANIESFLLFTTLAIIIEVLKTMIITKSVNLYALFQNIEDNTFIKILMK